jgi:plastocyanin
MTKTTKLVAVVLASAALFAAGCGGDDNDKSDSGGGGAYGGGQATTPADSGKANPGGTAAISMKDIQFAPKDDTVKVGQTVTWTNDDNVPHNVRATDGAEFKSDDFGKGGTYEFKPESAGTIKYTCTLHPGMDGTLEVTE